MADKVYQLPYDDEIDKDIYNWLQSLPRSRKAELVRNALRFYIQATQEGNPVVVNPSPVVKKDEEKKIPKRPNIPKDGGF